jgi:drug/metabolite transporter (DMT)-like permease
MQEVDRSRELGESKPKPPLSGVIYGEIVYWMVFIGMIISIAGVAMILTTESNYINSACLLNNLWGGKNESVIWDECAKSHPEKYWFFGKLNTGDGIGMVGIVLASVSAVVGVWMSAIFLFRDNEKLFFVFAVVTALILTASALGLINLGH